MHTFLYYRWAFLCLTLHNTLHRIPMFVQYSMIPMSFFFSLCMYLLQYCTYIIRPAISRRLDLLFSILGSSGALNHWVTLCQLSFNLINIVQLLFYSWNGSHYMISSTSIACMTYIWTRLTWSIQMFRPQSFHLFVGCT
jgi:hypothetical protein